MIETTDIFDLALLNERRRRIAPEFDRYDFLLKRIVADIEDRLAAIKREFPTVLSLGSHKGILGEICSVRPGTDLVIEQDHCIEFFGRDPGAKVNCTTESVPFRNASLDLVLSAMTLQYVNDLPGTLIQLRQALKPDGLFIGTMFGNETLIELRECFMLAEEQIEGGVSPRVIPMTNVQECGALLQRAGFTLPVTDTDILKVTYTEPEKLLHDLRGMGLTNVLQHRRKTPLKRKTLRTMFDIYKSRYTNNSGKLVASFETLTMTGWSPHESQQQPKHPGTAQVRLADALGTDELSSGEKASPGRKKTN